MGMPIDSTWQIQLNPPCVAVMRLFVKLFRALVIIVCLALSVATEKPAIHSSYFQQLMQDVAHTLQAESGNNTTLSTADNVDKVTREAQHSSTCDAASSSQPPVDSTKSTQQLIGESAMIAPCLFQCNVIKVLN